VAIHYDNGKGGLIMRLHYFNATIYYLTPKGSKSSYYWAGLAYGFNDAIDRAKQCLSLEPKRKLYKVEHTTTEAMLDYM
jgi:hypothetical protein